MSSNNFQRYRLAQEQILAIKEARKIGDRVAPIFYRSRDPETGWRYWASAEGSIVPRQFIGNSAPDVGNNFGNKAIGR
jgi:hypothetical protein